MTSLIPNFVKTGISRVFSGDEKPAVNTTNTPPPKDLNELVDRVMENQNIDNKTKREILSVILSNLQTQTSETVVSNQMPRPLKAPVYHGQEQMYYPPPPVYYPPPQMFQPQLPYQQMYAPQPYYQPPPQMYMPPPAPQPSYQLDYLTSKVNDLYTELGDLINVVKSQSISPDKRSDNMNRIQSLISNLSAANTGVNTAASNMGTASANNTGSASASNMESSGSNNSSSEQEDESLTTLPDRAKNAIGSVSGTISSALNGMNNLFGTNTKATDENKPLSDEEKEILSDAASEKGDNMVDLGDYKSEPQESLNKSITQNVIEQGLANNAAKPVLSGNNTTPAVSSGNTTPAVSSGNTTPAPTVSSGNNTTPAPAVSSGNTTIPAVSSGNTTIPAVSSGNNTTPAPTVSSGNNTTPAVSSGNNTTPAVSSGNTTTPAPAVAANIPAQGLVTSASTNNTSVPTVNAPTTNAPASTANTPAPTTNTPAPTTNAPQATTTTDASKPPESLSEAIANLNPPAQTGGSRTLKKGRSILSAVADALGVSDKTQKKKRAPKQKKSKSK